MTISQICICLAIAVYLIAMLGVGVWFSKRNNSVDDFYLGGRKYYFIALLMLLTCSVTIGPFLLAFSHTPERVLEVQGQTLVEEDKSFLDPHYVYYIGFGPLLRSRESVWSGDTPLDQGGTGYEQQNTADLEQQK